MINMPKDDAPMLKYICKRLKVGHVYVYDHFASYSVTSKNDLQFAIFDKSPLNTSKHLNYPPTGAGRSPRGPPVV